MFLHLGAGHAWQEHILDAHGNAHSLGDAPPPRTEGSVTPASLPQRTPPGLWRQCHRSNPAPRGA
eukprot:8709284-Pyramimonas_sp.AAC.1